MSCITAESRVLASARRPSGVIVDKMATAGADWATNPATQIKWGLGYIKDRYGTPSAAWSYWQANGWY